ncbi:MAG: hypothetical protein ACP5HK_03645 [Acidilobus sp.]
MSWDDLEPTQRAGPCLEEVFTEIDRDEVNELFSTLYNKEYNTVEVLLHEEQDRRLQVYARCFVSARCLVVLEVVAETCGRDLSLSPFEWPEVDRAEVVGECLRLASRPEPPLKARRLLSQLGVTEPRDILGYRPAGGEDLGG